MGKMECRGDPAFRQGVRSQSLQHAGGNGVDVFPQSALAQSGSAGARAAVQRSHEQYHFLRRLRGRAGGEHRRAGAGDRLFLVDGDRRRPALPLSAVSALLRGLPDLCLVFARPVLCASAGGVERRHRPVAALRPPARLAPQCRPRRRLPRAVHFRPALGALHLRLRRAGLCRDQRRADPGAGAAAERMGMEDRGAGAVPDLLFRVRTARLLSRHDRHGRPHADGRDGVGPAPLRRCLAAAHPRSLAVRRSTPHVVHQGSRRVVADRRPLRRGAGHRHAPRRHPHRRLGFDRLSRPRARLRLCLSGRLARAGRRSLQPFSDAVLLVVRLHVRGRSLLRAVPFDERDRSPRRARTPAAGRSQASSPASWLRRCWS